MLQQLRNVFTPLELAQLNRHTVMNSLRRTRYLLNALNGILVAADLWLFCVSLIGEPTGDGDGEGVGLYYSALQFWRVTLGTSSIECRSVKKPPAPLLGEKTLCARSLTVFVVAAVADEPVAAARVWRPESGLQVLRVLSMGFDQDCAWTAQMYIRAYSLLKSMVL